MTPKQIERKRNKIEKIKKALAADKRRSGGAYDDSRGLRYLPPALFLQLQDYPGALKYFKWFNKNFPDDRGFPVFLFEWSITLFKTGDIIGAEKKALKTFFLNNYLIDKFLGREFQNLDQSEIESWEFTSLTKGIDYNKVQNELLDFADWIAQFQASDKFINITNEYFDIEQKLLTEPVGKKRTALVNRLYTILDNYE